MNTIRTTRRVVIVHTAGPYPGLRQIIGLIPLSDAAPAPEVLPPPGTGMAMALWPDQRGARALRLRSTERYVLYQERPVEGQQVAA
jgi:hypothetical protein